MITVRSHKTVYYYFVSQEQTNLKLNNFIFIFYIGFDNAEKRFQWQLLLYVVTLG